MSTPPPLTPRNPPPAVGGPAASSLAPAPAAKPLRLATASVVLGVLAHMGLMLLTAIPSIVCGHLALARIRRDPGLADSRRAAIAGLWLGYTGVAVSLLLIGLIALLVWLWRSGRLFQ